MCASNLEGTKIIFSDRCLGYGWHIESGATLGAYTKGFCYLNNILGRYRIQT